LFEISLLKSSKIKDDLGRESRGLAAFFSTGKSSPLSSSSFFLSFFFSSFGFSSLGFSCLACFYCFGLSCFGFYSPFSALTGFLFAYSSKTVGTNSFSAYQVFPRALTNWGKTEILSYHFKTLAN
jgi:hypothetical protein